jgi:hypothetical protein
VLVAVPEQDAVQAFDNTLKKKGRARLTLSASIFEQGEEKVRYRGRYAVRMRNI